MTHGYYWDPYKRTRPLRNVPPAGFLKISCVPVQHKRTPYRPSEKTQKSVPPPNIRTPYSVGKKVKSALEISNFFAEFAKSGIFYATMPYYGTKKALFESY